MDTKELGTLLRHARQTAGVTQKRLAERTGKHASSIDSAERGEGYIVDHAAAYITWLETCDVDILVRRRPADSQGEPLGPVRDKA